MLDFTRLHTPPNDGDVLVAPAPSDMVRWARENHAALTQSSVGVLGRPLSAWRAETRKALGGDDHKLLIVLGHQPEFIHAGVWAKHVVAHRLARAVEGTAINLIVDNDAPGGVALNVPFVEDGLARSRLVRCADVRADYAYEQIGALSRDEVRRFAEAVRGVMGDRFDRTYMPVFFTGVDSVPASKEPCGGWVDQHVAGRRAIERTFGIELIEHAVSVVGCSPVVADILLHAKRFHASYNNALASYRRSERIRGNDRPIPDLQRRQDAFETPLWVYRTCEARRRLFVERAGDVLRLFADRDEIGSIDSRSINTPDVLRETLAALGGWRLRPRALALTLWARLLLADLFIHGIGGAKYDRIADAIMRDYYGIDPPKMACVSATLLLDLPRTATDEQRVRALEHDLRDIRFNPQRHIDLDARVADLLRQRSDAVRHSEELRNGHPSDHRARRAAFRRIRSVNAAILATRADAVEALAQRVAAARVGRESDRIAGGREYFFGLHDERGLHRLLDALPSEAAFAV